MSRFSLSTLARRDLDGIYKEIAYDRPSVAEQMITQLLDVCEMLGDSPDLGELVENAKLGLGFFTCRRWVVYYRPRPQDILIIRVLDGMQDRSRRLQRYRQN